MAITPKVLADGQLSNSKTTLYTVVDTYALIKFMSVFNVASTTETIKLYINSSGTSRQIAQVTLAENEFAYIIESETITLELNDIIEAESTNASAIDYLITGVTET